MLNSWLTELLLATAHACIESIVGDKCMGDFVRIICYPLDNEMKNCVNKKYLCKYVRIPVRM